MSPAAPAEPAREVFLRGGTLIRGRRRREQRIERQDVEDRCQVVSFARAGPRAHKGIMARQSLVFALTLTLGFSLTTIAHAEERGTSQDDAPGEAPTHVRFDSNGKASLMALHDGTWELKCKRSCSFDMPASFDGGLYVVAGDRGDRIGPVPLPARAGETLHIQHDDRQDAIALLGALGGLTSAGGLTLMAIGFLNAVGEGLGRATAGCGDPGANCGPDTRSDQTGFVVGGLALFGAGVAAMVGAVVLPRHAFHVVKPSALDARERSPGTPLRSPQWTERSSVPASTLPKAASVNLFTLKF